MMSYNSKIEWTDATWNFLGGCSPCSPGCTNCAAARLASGRLKNHPLYKGLTKNGKWTGEVRLCTDIGRNDILEQPLHWRKPRQIFPCFMGDLFHEKVPFEFIDKTLYIMYRNLQHTFQILTKRPKRMLEYFADGELLRLRLLRLFPNYTPEARLCREWPLDNVHIGVSISTQDEMWKAKILLDIPAAVKYISFEPLLENIYLDTEDVKRIDGAIIGCESGPNRRECKNEWVMGIVEHFHFYNKPVFVKQINVNGKVVKMPKEFPQELPERPF